jgi:hypothetical protein
MIIVVNRLVCRMYRIYSEARMVENSTDKNILLQKENLSGLCAVYKPSGISSSFVVGKIKYILQRHCTEHIFGMKQKCKIKVMASIKQ